MAVEESPATGWVMEESPATAWVAWVLFGGILLVLIGTIHLCVGLLGLYRPEVLAGGRGDQLLPVSLTAIAWLHLVLAVTSLITGVALILGFTWARIVAILLAVLTAMVSFIFAANHPIWSVITVLLAGVIVYAIAAHGGELADASG